MKSKKNESVITSPESAFKAVSSVLEKKQEFVKALEWAGVKDAKVLLSESKDAQIEEVVKIGISYLILRKKAVSNLQKVFSAKAITLKPAVVPKSTAKEEPRAKYLKPEPKVSVHGKKPVLPPSSTRLTITTALTGLMRDKPALFEKGFKINDILDTLAGRMGRTISGPDEALRLGRSFSPTLAFLRRNKVIEMGKSKGEWKLVDGWDSNLEKISK